MRVNRRFQRRANMVSALRRCLNGPLTLTEIAQQTGITRPAAESVIADLQQLGWISQTAPPELAIAPGRPSAYFGLNPTAGHVLSIDIGATRIHAVTATLAGEILCTASSPVAPTLLAPARLDAAAEVARRVLTDTAAGEPLLCVAGSPGIQHQGTVAYYGGAGMPGWQGTDLQRELGVALGLPIRTAGDCALGARGESWLGAAEGFRDVVYILAGKRTGAAAVIDGRVHEGLSGSAGLIGELPQLRWRTLEEETFAADVYGVATFARSGGVCPVTSNGNHTADNGTTCIGKPHRQVQPSREEIFEAARAGDPQALLAAERYVETLSLGTAAMVLALAPQCVVIGGTYGAYADIFLDQLRAQLGQVCPFMPEVCASKLGGRAVVLGGVRYALDYLYDTLDHLIVTTDYFPAPSRELISPH